MAGKRRHKRIIKRLNTEFSSEGISFRGTSSNLSGSGLFLRTIKPLPTNAEVEVRIQLPDETISRLKGTVRWSLKSAMKTGRSGMGIEISEYDRHYVDFLNTLLPPEEQIQYHEHKKSLPTPPAAKVENAAHRDNRHPHPENRHIPHPKSPHAAEPKGDQEKEDDKIDSLISSLFSKREKK